MTGLAAISVDKLGRKPLLLMSGLGCSLSVICVGVFFYLDENKKCLYDRDIQSPIIFNQSMIFFQRTYLHWWTYIFVQQDFCKMFLLF